MNAATSIAQSGMAAAVARLDASAQNLANMNSRGVAPGETGQAVYRPVRVEQKSLPGGGVTSVTHIQTPGYVMTPDSASVFADAQGLVATPAVDLGLELVEQMQALHQFKANLRTLEAANEATDALLDMFR